MVESGKSSSILSLFSTLLLKVWEKWDVRGMVLFSLTLQIVLFVLGSRRKYTINPFSKLILWLAYIGADWIALATLGKLSSSYTESPTTNVLRAYWAPLLLLHLGGPDTITAFAFEDNKLWIRHLLILLVKAIFVIYIICLSWTFSWLSFLSLPLILAGIIKYVEKILCLRLNNSHKTNPLVSDVFNPQSLNHLQEVNPILSDGYQLFTIMRPDVNDYLSSNSRSSTRIRIQTNVKKTTGVDDLKDALFQKFDNFFEHTHNLLDVFVVELEFIFDVIYTKFALVYTKLGCLLRLTIFASLFSVLLLYFISIINESKFHFSRVDIAITGILLTGAITLELYAVWVMLSSDWAIFVATFHYNVLVRKMFSVVLKRFSWLFHRSKRWSNEIGQFDLLNYCWLYKKKEVNQAWGILRNITNGSDIIEMWHKYKFTSVDQVPKYLKDTQHFLVPVTSFLLSDYFGASKGQRALERAGRDDLSWSVGFDFDYNIIIWHLATSVCYYQEHHDDDDDDNKVTGKHVSDYMMYLLVMCPTLIVPDHSKSFWLDHTYDKLKELLCFATDITDAASKLFPDHNIDEEELESSESTIDNVGEEEHIFRSRKTTLEEVLQKDVCELARHLKQLENKWEVIRDVWMEMLVYAVVSNPHISHLKQLGEGIEFLSLIWLFVGFNAVLKNL